MRLRQTLNAIARSASRRPPAAARRACASRRRAATRAAEQQPLREWAVISERHCSRDTLRSREFSTQFTERSTFAVH